MGSSIGCFSGSLFWALLGFLLLLPISWVSCCPPHEQTSLFNFRQKLHDPSGRLKTWNDSTDCCNWEGIKCDNITMHVIQLDLHNPFGKIPAMNLRDLNSAVPSDISVGSNKNDVLSPLFDLKMLQVLDLSYNAFIGVGVPQQLGTLKYLRYLDLSNAGFMGKIPAGLQNLSNLVSLKLSNSELQGSIPSDLLSLPNLQEVDLSANLHLRGELSSILPRHSASLKSIVLTATSVGGAIPNSIANISSLTHLDLSDCCVKGMLPPTIANLTELVMLDISNNMLNGSLPPFGGKSHLVTSYALAHIDLSYNQLQGSIATLLSGAFENLSYVDLSHNRLTSAIPSPALNLTSLTSLDLSYNELNGTIPSFANMNSLVLLYLSNNHFTGKIQASIAQLVSLSTLDLSHNMLTDAIPKNITNLSKLKVLSLSSNRLSGNLSDSDLHMNLSSLVYLDISNNEFSVKVSPSWIPRNSFRALKLGSCNMEGELPAFLITQYDISDLDLSDNRLWGNIPAWIWDSLPLQQLNLSYNSFTGALPSKLTGPKRLKILDLHHNNFQGPLPLPPPSVALLDLSENQFNGGIPKSLGKMEQLEFLDLSQNQLSGIIPLELVKLTYLSYLNFSYNYLTGEIPKGGQFMTFDTSSFSNNSDLCGIQLYESCCNFGELTKPCLPSPPTTLKVNKTDEDDDVEENMWWGVSVGLCFAFAFNLVIGVLSLPTTLGRRCLHWMDRSIVCLFGRFRKLSIKVMKIWLGGTELSI